MSVLDNGADPAFAAGALPDLGPRLVITKDGVVVAVDDPHDGSPPRWWQYHLDGPQGNDPYIRATELVVCAAGQGGTPDATGGVAPARCVRGGARGGHPLAGFRGVWRPATGEYGPTQEQIAAAPRATVLGTPVPFTITMGTATPDAEPLPLDEYAAS
ncbi:MAG: hypothetical protein JWP95_1423 [Actinotalea sp.]|nr:hypothetical protein [Actinotalea sp.]